MIKNGSEKAPKWLPGGLRAAAGVPGGPWAAQGRLWSDFKLHFGVHLGPPNHLKIRRKARPNQAAVLIIIFDAPEASGASLGGHFGGDFGWFFGPQGDKHELLKNLDF